MTDLGRRREIFEDLVKGGFLDRADVDGDDPLGWLVESGVGSVAEAGYRFALEPDVVGTVLTGTSSVDHLRQNLAAVASGPLPSKLRAEIAKKYGQLTRALGN